MRILTAIAAGAALVTTATSANAEDRNVTKLVEMIKFHDLDLSTAAGLSTLNQRIDGATDIVCGSYAKSDYFEWGAIGRCRISVRRSVEPQIAQAIGSARTRLAAR